MNIRRSLLCVLAVSALLPVAAFADTIHISAYTGESIDIVATKIGLSGWYTAGSVIINDVTGGNLPSSFTSYCVDLQHYIHNAGNYTATLALMSTWNGYGDFTPQAHAGDYAAYLYLKNVSSATTDDQMAGLALAIWNVLYDTDFTVSSGDFQAIGSTNAILQANTYLSNLSANQTAAAGYDAYWLHVSTVQGFDVQDFIAPRPSSLVPEPGTMLLLGTGLLVVAALRRRFRT